MGTADLHIHSVHSDGTATVDAILYHASVNTDLDVIAIADHDTLEGALEAQKLADRFRVEVVPGMEISTTEGHLLALYLETPVSAGMSYTDTAERVRLFGGLPFAAHPTALLFASIGRRKLENIVERYPGLLAGIEAENGSTLHVRYNEAAQRLRWRSGLPGIGNSDAHVLNTIGSSYTVFPGKTAFDLRTALETGSIVPMPAQRSDRFFRRHVKHFALRFGISVVESLDVRRGEELCVRWRRVRRG